jgi:hypothetical protein
MYTPGFRYDDIVRSSEKVSWTIDEVLPPGQKLDFSKPFLPDALVGVNIKCLDAREKLVLNHINGNSYVNLFAFVEEYIIAYAVQHAQAEMFGDHNAIRALVRFADEEVKHQTLFHRYRECFERDFPTPCGVLGAAADVAQVVMSKSPIAVSMVTLHLEIMTQAHYTESIRNDTKLDPLFASLFKHHWMEEAQHARIDALELAKQTEHASPEDIHAAFDDYLTLGGAIDGLLAKQAELDVESLAKALGRTFTDGEREEIRAAQQAGYRRTFLTFGMNNRQFTEALQALWPEGAAKVAATSAALAKA